ncbi:MAG: NAD(P)/FAD-dependent oxidoreductase [Roseateles sp.]|jgi:predicted Rossmann fold flavoprotein|nr:aminoacetone oxidase family FAD-binding enzyme [Methylibium sp.]MBY0367403.1 NAD(P)/FAD-dependent oxidoreductase [Burkholderiaceae bacterium]|mmetsp:Transcript_39157/g.91833  ORF Transcript_39157/g.91833 Transcript_39157/m.91833 type:complete len:407 (-) Transcript_39157:249-1469(-)
MRAFDAVVVGAGAAGLFCAGQAGQRGLRVLLIDHAERLAEKIRISGGGRCNFTNREVGPANFLSDNPAFCRSALARYTPTDFIKLVQAHGIAFHEKHKGQLFCDDSSEQIIQLLVRECEAGGVTRWQPCSVADVRPHPGGGFELDTAQGLVRAARVVVATGGLPVPKIGASDWGLRLATRFGHDIVEPRPALVPLTFDPATWAPFAALAGLSLPVEVSVGSGKARGRFLEDLLFTHRGLSGPAILQISSYRTAADQPLQINLAPDLQLDKELVDAKPASRRQLGNEFATRLPQRLAALWLEHARLDAARPLAECRDADLQRLGRSVHGWQLMPSGDEGWRKAEVMRGGVSTRDLSSQTMESKRVPGLYFIGEVVDVTGWLGGYNFQWAWSSAWACAQALAAVPAVA